MRAQDTAREEELLLAHAGELLARARNGEITYTAFLTPREQKRFLVRDLGAAGEMVFDGGYPCAERCRAFFLPDYVREAEGELRDAMLAEVRGYALTSLLVRGSGYAELSHRDYLGAILALGIERDAIGDICVMSPSKAVLFCDRRMVGFLSESLLRVARDAVTVSDFVLPPDFDGGRRYLPVSDTVASPRADAVVAALCDLSRERAQALFAAALVEIDYEPCEKNDREVTEGAILTVRGHGKFVIRSLSDKTKKGRFRLLADRYV